MRVSVRSSVALNSYGGEEEDPTPLMHNSTSKKERKNWLCLKQAGKWCTHITSALRTLRQKDHKLHMNLGCLTKKKHDYLKPQRG